MALPGIHTNPIAAAPGVEPYAARLWQFRLDLVAARSDEFLFEPDMDLVRIRRRLRDAFLAQRDGVRVALADDALAFPV